MHTVWRSLALLAGPLFTYAAFHRPTTVQGECTCGVCSYDCGLQQLALLGATQGLTLCNSSTHLAFHYRTQLNSPDDDVPATATSGPGFTVPRHCFCCNVGANGCCRDTRPCTGTRLIEARAFAKYEYVRTYIGTGFSRRSGIGKIYPRFVLCVCGREVY